MMGQEKGDLFDTGDCMGRFDCYLSGIYSVEMEMYMSNVDIKKFISVKNL